MKTATIWRTVAVLAILALLAEVALSPVGMINSESPASPAAWDGDDRRIAADISNLTGASIDEVLRLREGGLSWNQVTERLKREQPGAGQLADNRVERAKRLASSDVGDEFVREMTAQGYGEQEIMEARMLAERVQFGLNEIVQGRDALVPKPEIGLPAGGGDNKEDEKMEGFRKLAESFVLQDAVYYMVVLKPDFGSPENVLDEYLLALQLEISLETYVEDKRNYLEQKEEKILTLLREQRITSADIELAQLEKVRQNNAAIGGDLPVTGTDSVKTLEQERPGSLPDVPMPNVRDVKPVNPADEIRRELDRLNPNPM